MTYFNYNYDDAYSQNFYYDEISTHFSYHEEFNTDVSFNYEPYQVNPEPEYSSSSYQIAEPTVFPLPSYYIQVPYVTAIEVQGTTYYEYTYFSYPVYSTPDFPSVSYDDLDTTVPSNTAVVPYSENVSSSMASINTFNTSSEIKYTNIQVSNNFFVNSLPDDWQNDNQINTECDATDYNPPNIGASGDFQAANSTTVCNGSDFSEVNSSNEASNIQFKDESKQDVKLLKESLSTNALSGNSCLKDSVPADDIPPVIQDEPDFIQEGNNANRANEVPETTEKESLTVAKDKKLNLTYEKSASSETSENDSNNNCDFLRNVNSDSQATVPDWTVEVDSEISQDEYDGKEHFNQDSEKEVLDWSTEVEEIYFGEEYEDAFYKIDDDSSPNIKDEYDSKEYVEYRKEQLYISALSGYMSLKEDVPIVDILPVIQEESSSTEDDCKSELNNDCKSELNNDSELELNDNCKTELNNDWENEKTLDENEIYEEINHVKEESKLNELSKDYLSVITDTKVESGENLNCEEKTIIKQTGVHLDSDMAMDKTNLLKREQSEHPFNLENNSVKSDGSSTEENNNLNSRKEVQKHEKSLMEDSSTAGVQTIKPTSSNEIKANKGKNRSKMKKKRFQGIRNWFRSLSCCMKKEPS